MKQLYKVAFSIFFGVVWSLGLAELSFGQVVKDFGNEVTVSSNVTNPGFAVDEDLFNFARVRSSSGVVVDIGAFSGTLEIKFGGVLEAEKTSYIRLDFEDEVFNALLGGNLGVLLGDILGGLFSSNHILEVEARNGGSTVLRGTTSDLDDFAGDRMRVVVDESGDFFLALTPPADYDRVWIRDITDASIGLGVGNETRVYYTFNYTGNSDCPIPVFTGFDVEGVTPSGLGSNRPVQNPEFAIDGSPDSFSTFSLGVLDEAGFIRQDVYFDSPTDDRDELRVRLRFAGGLPGPLLLDNITVLSYRENAEVFSSPLSSLVDPDMLDLLQTGQAVDIPFQPGMSIDRVALRYSSNGSSAAGSELEFGGVTIGPPSPSPITPDGESFTGCEGDEIQLLVQVDEPFLVRWYDEPVGGNLLATTAANEPFNPGQVTTSSTFYAATYDGTCDVESSRLAIAVNLIPSPGIADIEVVGNMQVYCGNTAVTIQPRLSEESDLNPALSEFKWYRDSNKAMMISDGDPVDGGSVLIEANGTITLTGLPPGSYMLYVSVAGEVGCESPIGELLPVEFEVIEQGVVEIGTGDSTICEGESFTLSATAPGIANPVFRFYTDAALTDELTDLTVMPAVTTTYYVTVEGDGICENAPGDAAELTVTVNPAATAADIEVMDGVICEGGSFTLSATAPGIANPVFRFYTDAALTDELTDLTVMPTVTTTYYVTVEGDGICGNPVGTAAELTVTVNPAASAADIEVMDGTICEGESFTLSATAPGIANPVFRFYTDAALTNELTNLTVMPTVTTTYYVTVEGDNSCGNPVGAAAELTVTVNPAATSADIEVMDGTICEGESFTLSATAPGIANPVFRFYTDAALTDELTDLTVMPTTTTTYYVTVEGDNSCGNPVGAAAELTVTVGREGTSADIQVMNAVICEGERTMLSASSATVTNPVFRFYLDEELTMEVTDLEVSPLVTTRYYVTVIGEGVCENPVGDVAFLTVTVRNTASPEVSNPSQSFCTEDTPTVSDLAVSGTGILWYSTETAGMALAPDTRLVDGQTYYASQTDPATGCESLGRAAVTITLSACNEPGGNGLLIRKVASRTTVLAGSEVTYTLTVTNTENRPITDLQLTDELDGLLEFTNASDGGIFRSGTVTWEIASIGANAEISRTLTVSVADTASAGDEIPNVAVVASPTIEGSPLMSEPVVIRILEPENANLTVTKTAASPTVLQGGLITYTINVTNMSLSDASDIVVTDVLPEEVSFVSAGNGGEFADGTVSWNIGALEGGAVTSFELTVMAQDAAAVGTAITNVARLISPDDPDSPKVSDPSVVRVVDQEVLTVMKTPDRGQAEIGETVTYSIVITNTSSTLLQNITVTDTLPVGLDYVSSTLGGSFGEGIVRWETDVLEPGEQIDFILTVTINDQVSVGDTIFNTALADFAGNSGAPKESNPGEGVIVTAGEEVLDTVISISKEQDVTTVLTGGLITYSITVTNTGAFPAESISVMDSLPERTILVSVSDSGVQEGRIVYWEISSLAPGEERVLELQLLVTATDGFIINKVSVTGQNFPEQRDETVPIPVNPPSNEVNLQLLKEVSNTEVMLGTAFQYQITITNNSSNTANGVVVTDTLPSATGFADAVAGVGSVSYSNTSRVVTWRLTMLEPGASAVLTLTVNAEALGEVSNTAYVTSDGVETDSSDNRDTATHQQTGFLIPNVFTPNGDGVNDTWQIGGLSEFSGPVKVVVVNRWGVEVFKSSNYQNDWGANTVRAGTYFYELTVMDQSQTEKVFTGYITIIK